MIKSKIKNFIYYMIRIELDNRHILSRSVHEIMLGTMLLSGAELESNLMSDQIAVTSDIFPLKLHGEMADSMSTADRFKGRLNDLAIP